MTATYPVQRTSVGAAVLGLHVLAVVAWWSVAPPMPGLHKVATLPLVTLWLPELSLPARSPHTATERRNKPEQPSAPTNHRATAPHPTDNPATPPTAVAPATIAEDPPAPPVLNLALPPKDSGRHRPPRFSEQAEFQGRKPETKEETFAQALGDTGPWIEERIDNDHIRFRRGNTCIMMERSATERLMPMDEGSRRVPWKANTYRCR